MPPAALLLEFETLVADTRSMRREALAAALEEDGVRLTAEEYDEHCAGHAVADAVRAAASLRHAPLDETALDLATLRAERHFAALIGKGVSLAPGAAEFIERAAKESRLALVTRASRREVEFVLSLARLDAAFECVVAAEDAPAKPSPAPYLAALARLSRRRPVAAGEALALDDALPGIRAARAAGVRCVAVGALAAHAALEADAAVESLDGHTPSTLAALATRGEAHAR